MATQLQIMNRIMRRLREDQVAASTDNDYAALIAEFVREAYECATEDHMWNVLKHTTTVDITAGTTDYDLTRTVANGGNVRNSDSRVCTVDSELQYDDTGMPEVDVYDTDSDAVPNGAIFLDPQSFRAIQASYRTLTASDMFYYTVEPAVDFSVTPDVSRLYLRVYPEPTAARVIQITFWSPPSALAADGTTDSTVLLIPERPVYLYALMLALNERGEEIGEPGNIAEKNWSKSLAIAIDRDLATEQRGNRYDWSRD